MALKFIQTIKNEITANMPDNSAGLITPAILRTTLQDMVDSLYNRTGSIFGDRNAAPLAQALTTTPTNYPALYNASSALDPGILAADSVAGTVKVIPAGFVMEGSLSFTMDGANGRVVTAVLAKNGIAIPRFAISATMTGAGQKHSANIAIPLIGVSANDVFTMQLSADVAFSPNVYEVILFMTLKPTFSAT
jgi:hypothetical protein